MDLEEDERRAYAVGDSRGLEDQRKHRYSSKKRRLYSECDVWIYDFGSKAFSVAIIDNNKAQGIMIAVGS